jgi:aspartate kinase
MWEVTIRGDRQATATEAGPNTAMAKPGAKRVVMKFGGSSIADAGRIRFVCDLIEQQRRQEQTHPIVVCSAMGSSTNALLAAGDNALDGKVRASRPSSSIFLRWRGRPKSASAFVGPWDGDALNLKTGRCVGVVARGDSQVGIEAVKALHLATCDELQVSAATRAEVEALLGSLEKLLAGISYLGELSPRSKDALVSFGERLAVRLVAAQLNAIGIPAKAFDAWDVGVETSERIAERIAA